MRRSKTMIEQPPMAVGRRLRAMAHIDWYFEISPLKSPISISLV